MNANTKRTAKQSISRHLRIAILAAATLVCGVGGWAMATKISGAVLASGVVVVDASIVRASAPGIDAAQR